MVGNSLKVSNSGARNASTNPPYHASQQCICDNTIDDKKDLGEATNVQLMMSYRLIRYVIRCDTENSEAIDRSCHRIPLKNKNNLVSDETRRRAPH